MKKKILITGGTGYLGSSIINAFKEKYQFILLKRSGSDTKRILPSLEHLTVYDIEDLNDDLTGRLEVDVLLHCATNYGRRDDDAVDMLEANLILPLKLISLFGKQKKQPRFINTDTILDKQVSAYSLSKNQFKEWAHFFSDIVFVNLQLEHFFGPSDDKTKFVSFIIDAFINNAPELNLTKGEQIRSFTYIDDIVSAFEIIIDKIDEFQPGFTEFQLSSDEPIAVKDFVEMTKRLSGNTATKLNFGAVPYRNGEPMSFEIDSEPIRSLGWKPKVTTENGLTNSIISDKSIR